eukprot:7918370-Heterocapsa_arctica.AAC.1
MEKRSGTKTMLKANQIHMHKRAKTNKARLDNYVIETSDTEDNSGVIKNIRIFQHSIDEKHKRDMQEEVQRFNHIKIAEEKENNIIDEKKDRDKQGEVQRFRKIKVAEEKANKTFNKNKKPRKYYKPFSQDNMLSKMRKRKEEQDHYRSLQTTKKGKTDKMAECVTQA